MTIRPAAVKIAFSGSEKKRKTQSHSLGSGTNVARRNCIMRIRLVYVRISVNIVV